MFIFRFLFVGLWLSGCLEAQGTFYQHRSLITEIASQLETAV